MTRLHLTAASLAALALVVTVAGLGLAAHSSAEEVEDRTQDVEEESGALEQLAVAGEEGPESPTDDDPVVDRVASSLAAVGQALVTAAEVSGQALAATGSALADAAAALGSGVAAASVWTAHQITQLASSVGQAASWLGVNAAQGAWAGIAAVGSGLAWLGTRAGDGVVWLGASLGTLLIDAGRGLVHTWPESAQGQAAAAAAASGTAAAGGAAWYTRAWRYLKYVPGLAPLYTRISRDELLDHPARKEIYEAIEGQPGIHLSALSRELDASWGTLLHHLRKLEKAELVTSEKANGKRCFFLPGQVSDEEQEILPALENEKARRIAEFYASNPGASQSEAADTLGYSAALVSWHLQKLEDAGVVTREREGRQQRVGVTQKAQAVVAA